MTLVESCIKLLEALVGNSTVNPGGDELALAEFLAAELKRLNADSVEVCELSDAQRQDGGPGAYVYATFGSPKLLVNVHLDTVPVTTGWSREPLVLEADGDKLFGLGSADTKGAIACVLAALGDSTPKNVAILFSGDEERQSRCMAAFIDSKRGAQLERAIVCEPTARRMGIGHRGIRGYRFQTSGPGGHSSMADHVAKPNIAMARLALELDALGERYLETSEGNSMPGLCLNVGELHGGVAFNVIAERSKLSLSIRPALGFDSGRFDAELGTCIRAAGGSFELECVLDRQPFATRDIDAFAPLVGDAPREHATLDFWTEAALLSAAGIDAVVIGPGDIAVAHGPDEFVTVEDLAWATKMFRGLFASI